MKDYLTQFLVALPAVFFVVDPIGVVPLFLAMTAGDTKEKIRRTAMRACLVACGLMTFFALFGTIIFKVFGVSLGAFRVAGGILLLITALDMLRARPSETRTTPTEEQEGVVKEDVAIVPLAIPLLSGPGAIATAMVLMARGNSNSMASTLPVLAAILLTFVFSYFILRASGLVQRVLRQSGVAIVERVMGLILAAIAVQFIADGAKELLK
ncbi:MarC family protein [Myxococcus sp. MISCRS1]|jgi:multiple antibiotic resistance protein|uniref:MarC family protein n=1 Tax=Myxococcus TaxID=32 RepID=UPI001144D6FD|nr:MULTISPECIES: MarC family protein [Myxococcus]BDT35858.1 MarC family protein [Myxococcus sp. MH1]MBZ4401823.1 MarC family protein [Myxococcus sp. AS-1-15]MBZ4407370.1 MarC family protein [Myxococcus sp. XM-1-1-1]MCK8500322.1 MarC family protein [Myxococcus fulvus]MCY1002574.1 MarC family protein [Myxococcus sp. MISCRS1]